MFCVVPNTYVLLPHLMSPIRAPSQNASNAKGSNLSPRQGMHMLQIVRQTPLVTYDLNTVKSFSVTIAAP